MFLMLIFGEILYHPDNIDILNIDPNVNIKTIRIFPKINIHKTYYHLYVNIHKKKVKGLEKNEN